MSSLLCLRNEECQALSESQVQAELGRHELIVIVGIASGLTLPELTAVHSVEIDTAGKWLKVPSAFIIFSFWIQSDTPGDIVSLQSRCQFATRGVVLGDVAKKQIRLPLAVFTITPAYTSREDTHVTGILYDKVSGDE